jgi:hypothetical protein
LDVVAAAWSRDFPSASPENEQREPFVSKLTATENVRLEGA